MKICFVHGEKLIYYFDAPMYGAVSPTPPIPVEGDFFVWLGKPYSVSRRVFEYPGRELRIAIVPASKYE